MKIARVLVVVGLVVASMGVLVAAPAAAAITVTTTADEDNSDGDCSLREAVGSINTASARDACGSTAGPITVPAGTYPINSELTITAAMSIEGAGAGVAILDSSGLVGDSVFDANLAPSFELSGVTIRGGADYYVNAQCTGAPSLTVTDSVFDSPSSYGINNCNGTITIEGTTIDGSDDYGVNNNGGSVTMADSAVLGSGSYGINTNAGAITLTRSTVADSGEYGINANGGSVTLTNSTVSGAGDYLINTNQGAITLSSSTVVGSDGSGLNSNVEGSITNSVVADTVDDGCDLPSIASGGFNTVDDDSCRGRTRPGHRRAHRRRRARATRPERGGRSDPPSDRRQRIDRHRRRLPGRRPAWAAPPR